jgi:hypothetical protein
MAQKYRQLNIEEREVIQQGLWEGKSFIRNFDFPAYARRYLHPAQSSVSREHQTGPSKISLSNPTYRRTVS